MAKSPSFGFHFTADTIPSEFFDGIQEPLKEAATESFRTIAELAKLRLRAQVRANFKNKLSGRAKFENSFRSYAFPDKRKTRKNSLRPAVTVQANPSWAEIFEEGRPKTIRPAVAKFLAIPTETAEELGLASVRGGRGWNKHISQTKEAAERYGPLETVETKGGLFLVGHRDRKTLFLFNLVRNVTEDRKLSLVSITEDALGAAPEAFTAALAKAQK